MVHVSSLLFGAEIAGDLVLLDAGRDRYYCFAGTSRAELQTDAASPHMVVHTAGEAVDGIRLCAPPPEPFEQWLPSDGPVRIAIRDIAAMVGAVLLTTCWLQFLTPASWLRRARGGGAPCEEAERRDRLVAVFDRLLPWIPCARRCLPNSLLLYHYLRLRGMPTQIVFGVRAHPFEAHCWVQHQRCVLNDHVAQIRWYTPILTLP